MAFSDNPNAALLLLTNEDDDDEDDDLFVKSDNSFYDAKADLSLEDSEELPLISEGTHTY